MTIPVQKFQIGQRVRPNDGRPAYIIDMIYKGIIDEGLVYCGSNFSARASELTLAPERPPYVPSERGVVSRSTTEGIFSELYRCETDNELAARHAIEHAAYDAQGDGA